VWENIAYGKPDASPDQIIRAAKQANAHEFIVQLSEGYGTMVGERGVTLSGARQPSRARAIVRNTPILVLDEPTTGLDSSSGTGCHRSVGAIDERKTCIVVAHHLSTIRHADVIFVVKSQLVKRHSRSIAGRAWTICGTVQNSDLRGEGNWPGRVLQMSLFFRRATGHLPKPEPTREVEKRTALLNLCGVTIVSKRVI
jgi:hypothetical protein